jgi:hypothetical protein
MSLTNVIKAYGGTIAAPLGVWTLICVVVGIFSIATILLKRAPARPSLMFALWCIAWVIHVLIAYYTIVQISAWFAINSIHLSESERSYHLHLFISECAKMGALSTISLTIGTLITLGFYLPGRRLPS